MKTPNTKSTITRKLRDRAGKIYGKTETGQIIRLTPLKPWRGKSQRRQVIKQRRLDRQAAAANLAA